MKKARGIVEEILKFIACSQQTCFSLEVQATEMYETYNKKAHSRRPTEQVSMFPWLFQRSSDVSTHTQCCHSQCNGRHGERH